jgi:hypothetical protein
MRGPLALEFTGAAKTILSAWPTVGGIGSDMKARPGGSGLDRRDLEFGLTRCLYVRGHQEGGREHGDLDCPSHRGTIPWRAGDPLGNRGTGATLVNFPIS